MEPECSLPCSKQSATFPYPEPNKTGSRAAVLFTVSTAIHGISPIYVQMSFPQVSLYFTSSPYELHKSPLSILFQSVISSFFGPNILLSTLFSETFSLCSSFSIRDQVSQPYETTDISSSRTINSCSDMQALHVYCRRRNCPTFYVHSAISVNSRKLGMAKEDRRGKWNILNTHPTSDEHGKEGKSLYSPTGLGASATFLTPHLPMLSTDDAVSAPALTVVSGSLQPRMSLQIYSRNGICKFRSTHNQEKQK